MKKILTFIVSIILIVILFQSFYSGPETEAKMSQLLAKANTINLQYPQEKVYLHVDRPSYWASDDIWFKAYLQNSPVQTCNLYVELLNSKGTVIQKKICWAQNGLSYGDFHLPDTTSTGVYQIRAYTNWMRNFDEISFFRKNIIIWNLRDKKIASESTALKERKIDFQFFPEGGTFISTISNLMAFKVTDQNGKGLDVEGRIIDELGNEVTSFKSGFKGMGSFTMIPLPGKRYRAVAKVANQLPMEVALPASQEEGVTLGVERDQSELLHLHISEKHKGPVASTYYIVGRAAGEMFYKKEVQLEKGSITLDLQKNTLPSGILQFTLFDNDLIPRCERLAFVNLPEVVDISIKPDEEEYPLRAMVQMDLEAFDKEDNPCLANLSVSAYHPDTQLKWEEYPQTIISQFLLGSELKGVIEEPGWYFKDQSPATLGALDNLMLTHGWRHFEWKQIKEDRSPKINYPAEENLQLRGTVKSIVRGNPVPNATVTMMTVNSLLSVKDQKTDSLGRFVFPELFFNDTIDVSLQAVNPKGKKNTVIELDERSSLSPEANYMPAAWQYYKENTTNANDYLKVINNEVINKKWRLSDTILLNDIRIKAEKVKKSDGHSRMYADPDWKMDVSKQDNAYSNIIEMIDGKMAGVRYEQLEKAFFIRGNAEPAVLMLDGLPANFELIESMAISNFDKVEVLKYAPMLGVKGNNGAIFFYLNRGVPQKYIHQDALGMKSAQVIGYSVIRQFYSPQYDPNEMPEIRKDFRNTLYWNPVVQTDSTGMAVIGYFNSDQAGEVQVVVEGVTSDGKLCRGVAKYRVTQ